MHRLLVVLTLLVSCSAFALDYDEPSFEEFFKIEQNKAMYKAAVESGKMQQAKEQMVAICKKWTKLEENADAACECAKQEILKLSDEMLFYSSITEYNRYQAKVEALKNGDKQRFEALKKHFAENPLMQDGFYERIEEKCTSGGDASTH